MALTIIKKKVFIVKESLCRMTTTKMVGIFELICLKRNSILVTGLEKAQVGQQMLPVDDSIRANLIN